MAQVRTVLGQIQAKVMIFSKRCLLLSAFVLAGLGGSIFLNFLLFEQAKKYYFELNQTRLDPLGLGYYPANLIAAEQADQTQVVFFGDSRAINWIAPDIGNYTFINRGISSQTAVQSAQRFSFHVGSLNPDFVIIQVGINDLKTVALFPDERDAIVATCQENIRQIVEASRELGATVIITTIFPTGRVPLARRPFWSTEIDRAVAEVNAYIATLADDNTIVFDAFSILADDQGSMLEKYSADELHINRAGYAALNQALMELLNTI